MVTLPATFVISTTSCARSSGTYANSISKKRWCRFPETSKALLGHIIYIQCVFDRRETLNVRSLFRRRFQTSSSYGPNPALQNALAQDSSKMVYPHHDRWSKQRQENKRETKKNGHVLYSWFLILDFGLPLRRSNMRVMHLSSSSVMCVLCL